MPVEHVKIWSMISQTAQPPQNMTQRSLVRLDQITFRLADLIHAGYDLYKPDTPAIFRISRRIVKQASNKKKPILYALCSLALIGLSDIALGSMSMAAQEPPVQTTELVNAQATEQTLRQVAETAFFADSAQAVLNYQDRRAIFEPRAARYGMVSSDHFLASQAGSEILSLGGNAVDAAVATAFALAVVLPYAGNLGGGGFALIHTRADNQTLALDFRETAPANAHEDMFLDKSGRPVARMSIESTASVGVPGSVAGLLAALDRTGSLPRDTVMAPAITLAKDGFEVTPNLASLLSSHADHLYKSPPNRKIFFKVTANAVCKPEDCPRHALRTLQAGETLQQTDLATTLQRIRDQGPDGFYKGPVAKAISQLADQSSLPGTHPHAGRHAGLISLADLAGYEVRWREPVRSRYRDLEVVSMPPPSSGGVHLIQMLNTLSHFPMQAFGSGSAASLHVMAEAARRAYADRAQHMGDPDFVDIPIKKLISADYALELFRQISMNKATQSSAIKAWVQIPTESPETTHLSVVDQWGNMVSLTTTLNLNFGSGWMADGTGVLLNNEMDDFSIKPGVPNAFGLIGSHANRIEAGKRPLSSMTPTIVFRDGIPFFATGTPGGSRIITIVLQVIVNVADHGMNIAAAGAAPRMHHQWLPDRMDLEPGFSPDTIRILRGLGHQIAPSRAAGRVQSVAIRPDAKLGASDPRSEDGAAIGPLKATKPH